MDQPQGQGTGREPVRASRGMVAAPHHLASAAGLDILRQGGSAVDAAIAANAVLCVAYPHMAGLGGDGFWLIHEPGAGLGAINASGPSARLATRDHYRDQGHQAHPPERGPMAALTVPGAVDGWRIAHERHGRLPWASLFQDAIRHARGGVAVSPSLAAWVARETQVLRGSPTAGRLYLPEGRPIRVGAKIVQDGLGRTFEVLARDGARQAFYEGPLAKSLCDPLQQAGSPLRPDDLAAYQATWVEPLSTTYRGFTAYGLPPNTQGFTALQILNLLEGFPLADWGDDTADYYHHMAEAVKLAFADRDAWLTDPAFVHIPVERLLSKEYAAERRRRIDPHEAMDMEAVEAGIPFKPGATGSGGAGGDTCYFCAVDRNGLAVSAIQSIYHAFGSAFVAGDTGVTLQNRGASFSLDDAHANRLEPGKRTAHTLIPAILFRDGEPYLLYGTMGGEGQPQTHAALVTRVVDFSYDVQQAIDAPRWVMGRTWGAPSRDLALEGRVPDHVARELLRRGQPVKVLADWDDRMGHAQAIRIHRDQGLLEGGADPRGDGVALGY